VLGPMGETLRFTKRDQDVMIHTVVEPMASEGLRTICIAYRDFTTCISYCYIAFFALTFLSALYEVILFIKTVTILFSVV